MNQIYLQLSAVVLRLQ